MGDPLGGVGGSRELPTEVERTHMLPWRGKAKHEPDRLRHSYGLSDWILQQQGYGPGHLMVPGAPKRSVQAA
jgi:hypothetical protein